MTHLKKLELMGRYNVTTLQTPHVHTTLASMTTMHSFPPSVYIYYNIPKKPNTSSHSLAPPHRSQMLPYATLQEAEAAIGRPLTTAETLWFNYTANKSDYILYCHNIPLIFILTTIVPLFYLLVEHLFPHHVAPYKVQPKIKISLYDNFKCFLVVTRTFFLIVAPLLLLSYPSIEMIGIRTSLPLPSSMEIVCQLAIYFVIEDYSNYWLHRLFHVKWLYEKIHKVHHEYTAPMAFATQHAHWVELVVFGIPSYLGPAIVPGHMVTFLLWLALRQIEAIENHSGYDFPWTLKKYIPFSAGADYHDYHHYVGGQSQSNFAPIFTYCDYIYGTDKGYRYRKKLLKQQQLKYGSKSNGLQNGGSYASVPDIKSE